MTDSADVARTGKRDRLVTSAGDLMHRQGSGVTTLAHVAEAAQVPAGNVYYYFKAKDDLVRAVINDRADSVRKMLGHFDSRRTPAARLKALVRHWADMREAIAEHGCPLGSLCADLNQRHDDVGREAATILRLLVDWAEVQFRDLGRRDAGDLAVALIAGVQGAALLSNTFADPNVMTTQARSLERWIDQLSQG